jgi:hypothetical protein
LQMLSSCSVKLYVKEDGHVKPASKKCRKSVASGSRFCGHCHAVRGDKTVCPLPVPDGHTNFCNFHKDWRGE